MHLLDGFTIVIDKPGKKPKKCEYKAPDHGWTANLSGSSKTLEGNLGNKPHATSVSQLSSSDWPSQAHHLIPHKTLAKHPVKHFLKKGSKLYEDTKYNVDHKKNGMWLPYSWRLAEWKGLSVREKRDLSIKVMRTAGLQLHQGSHQAGKFSNAEASYQDRVKGYLNRISNNAISHYAEPGACDDCKSSSKGGKYPARDNTRRFVDLASYCVKKDILTCKIFVSAIASEFEKIGGLR